VTNTEWRFSYKQQPPETTKILGPFRFGYNFSAFSKLSRLEIPFFLWHDEFWFVAFSGVITPSGLTSESRYACCEQ
jgi:hypothetical protein